VCGRAAPSKVQRPSGNRVKTDAKDAIHLARLLRLHEVTAVSIPSADQEAARDLVRTREDCRGDLMRSRHRLSKLLLRHGIVYYDGQAWTGKHDIWLRHEALPQLQGRATRLAFNSDYDTVLVTKARRDRLDAAIGEMAPDSEFTPLVRRLGCLRGVSTPDRVRARGRDRRVAPVHRQHDRLLRGPRAQRVLAGTSRVQGSITKTGNTHVRRPLSRPPGTTAPATPSGRHARSVGPGARRRAGPGR
jgi:transposase